MADLPKAWLELNNGQITLRAGFRIIGAGTIVLVCTIIVLLNYALDSKSLALTFGNKILNVVPTPSSDD